MGAVAGVVVGLALLLAGALKLASPLWPVQAAELGVPSAASRVVPWIEIAVGSLVAARFVPPVMGVVAAGLLAAFTVLLVVRLAQGRRPPCACFGTRSARPIGPGSVVRNLVLIALALVAAFA
jgi:hypothetical protein